MEFPQYKDHCGQEDCKVLDFLPASCSHCSKTFCSFHLSPFLHSCEEFKTKIVSDKDLEGKERERWQVKCEREGCKVKTLVPIRCPSCSKCFCLDHRFGDQHDCASYAQEQAEKASLALSETKKKEEGREIQNKIRQDINEKLAEAKGAGGAKGAMARKLALMKLKGRAQGDKSVPIGERVFFSVDCPNKDQNPNPLDVFMSKVWTFGKAVDFMARQARIKNKNNVTDAPKLHFFKGDLCLSNPFDKTLQQLIEDGMMVDGDALEFRMVPPTT